MAGGGAVTIFSLHNPGKGRGNVNAPEIYYILLAVAVTGLVLYLALRAEKRRREQMQQQAALLGFAFQEERDSTPNPFGKTLELAKGIEPPTY